MTGGEPFVKDNILQIIEEIHKGTSIPIIVLQKGNIVARGTDKQLKEQCKLYRQLYGEEEK